MARSIKEFTELIVKETQKIIVGKDDKIKLIMMAILSNCHVLLEDLPGSGKTTLIKAMSKALGLESSRIQFVPDLLPSDITGMVIFNQKKGDFELRKGPIMTNILLADEINRAIPRTQSALLEAMEERQITIDNERYVLPKPFLVLATENPVEMESTFKLPVAQMDRFLVRLSLGYLSLEDEVTMLEKTGDKIPFDTVETVTGEAEINEMIEKAEDVFISKEVATYIVNLVQATRDHGDISLGISPRGSKALYKAGKVWAAINGRDFVTPDDIKEIAVPVLAHRIILNPQAKYSGLTNEKVIADLLNEVSVGINTKEALEEI